MRVVRGLVNGLLMVTLVRPVVRLMVGRWRKRAQESAAATIGVPVQELLEAALIEELAAPAADLEAPVAEVLEQSARRSAFRTLLIGGILLAAIAGSALIAARLIRRRREAQAGGAGEREWVAVPIEEATSEIDEGIAEEALVE